jgi:hypothetical protein
MIVFAPDPSLDEIYPVDGIDWGGLIITCSFFDVTLKVTSDHSKDIREFIMHGLEERRVVDILYKGHIVLDNVNEFSLNPVHAFWILLVRSIIDRLIAKIVWRSWLSVVLQAWR